MGDHNEAYHNEALRRQRVLQKKCEAHKLMQEKNSSDGLYPVYDGTTKRSTGETDPEALEKLNVAIRKDLQHRANVLRNHNMYMGPMSAFNDLFATDQQKPNFKPSKFH